MIRWKEDNLCGGSENKIMKKVFGEKVGKVSWSLIGDSFNVWMWYLGY